MPEFTTEYQSWVLLAIAVVIVVLLITIYSFWNRRFIERGPRKGTAANPAQVRRDNPPDH